MRKLLYSDPLEALYSYYGFGPIENWLKNLILVYICIDVQLLF